MNDRELLQLDRLRELLDYDEIAGVFTWKKSNSNRKAIGSKAGGRKNSHGYMHISIDGKLYSAHRLAWFYVYGVWPNQIDHMNGDRVDNRIANLRSVSGQYNMHNQRKAHINSSTGALGVIAKPSGKFAAEIRVDGKKKYLGTFSSIDDASSAYMKAKSELHKGSLL